MAVVIKPPDNAPAIKPLIAVCGDLEIDPEVAKPDKPANNPNQLDHSRRYYSGRDER